MDGLIIKYEWLSHDFIYMKQGFQTIVNRHAPILFDCNRLTLRYEDPEGRSRYASYIGEVDGREFEFASVNLEKTGREAADEAIRRFFIERPDDTETKNNPYERQQNEKDLCGWKDYGPEASRVQEKIQQGQEKNPD